MCVRVYETGKSNLAGAINLFVSGAGYVPHLSDDTIFNKNRSLTKDLSARILSYDPLTILDQ